MLTASMMRRHGYSRSVAVDAIDAAVDALRSAVNITGRMPFGRLGEFVKDSSGALSFIPAQAMPLSVNPYGLLPKIPVTSVLAAARSEAGLPEPQGRDAAISAGHSPIFLPSRQSRRYWGRIAAMLAIIATFGIAFLNGDSDRGHTRPSLAALASYSGSSEARPLECELYIAYPDPDEATATVQPAVPERRDGAATVVAAPAADNNRRVYGLGAATAAKVSTPQAAKADTPAPRRAEPVPATSESGRYALIVASLPSRADARSFIASQGNPDLEIIEADGRYRVAISRSDSRAELERQQPAVSARYKGAWIYAGK